MNLLNPLFSLFSDKHKLDLNKIAEIIYAYLNGERISLYCDNNFRFKDFNRSNFCEIEVEQEMIENRNRQLLNMSMSKQIKYNKKCKLCRFKKMFFLLATIPKLKLKMNKNELTAEYLAETKQGGGPLSANTSANNLLINPNQPLNPMDSHSKKSDNKSFSLIDIDCDIDLIYLYRNSTKFFTQLADMFNIKLVAMQQNSKNTTFNPKKVNSVLNSSHDILNDAHQVKIEQVSNQISPKLKLDNNSHHALGINIFNEQSLLQNNVTNNNNITMNNNNLGTNHLLSPNMSSSNYDNSLVSPAKLNFLQLNNKQPTLMVTQSMNTITHQLSQPNVEQILSTGVVKQEVSEPETKSVNLYMQSALTSGYINPNVMGEGAKSCVWRFL